MGILRRIGLTIGILLCSVGGFFTTVSAIDWVNSPHQALLAAISALQSTEDAKQYDLLHPQVKVSRQAFAHWIAKAHITGYWAVDCDWTVPQGGRYAKVSVYRGQSMADLELWWETAQPDSRLVALRMAAPDLLSRITATP